MSFTGSKVLRIFRQSRFAQCTKNKAKTLFSSKNLLATNSVITICLSGTGDFLQQRYEVLCNRQKKLDKLRTKQICCTGAVIGPLCHFWYVFLDRILPGKTMKIVAKKVLVDQLIFSPVNISVFVIMMGILHNKTKEELFKDVRTKGADLFVAEWLIWPPAQAVNFALVPMRFRVLYDNTVSLGFDCYYSYVMFKKDPPRSVVDRKGIDHERMSMQRYCCKIPEHSSR